MIVGDPGFEASEIEWDASRVMAPVESVWDAAKVYADRNGYEYVGTYGVIDLDQDESGDWFCYGEPLEAGQDND